jgi:putative transposase
MQAFAKQTPRGAILRQAEGDMPVVKLCREHGMSDAPFYKWRGKYGGMDASMVSQSLQGSDAVLLHYGQLAR